MLLLLCIFFFLFRSPFLVLFSPPPPSFRTLEFRALVRRAYRQKATYLENTSQYKLAKNGREFFHVMTMTVHVSKVPRVLNYPVTPISVFSRHHKPITSLTGPPRRTFIC